MKSPAPHTPPAGPDEVAATHWLLLRHHPHALLAAHASHVVSPEQGSGGGGHVDGRKLHWAEVHSLLAGPSVVPVTQRLRSRHHPHPRRDAHVLHAVLLKHGSTIGTSLPLMPASEAMHADGTHAQSAIAQLPSVGPEALPGRQVLVLRHHPQEPIGVQVPQLVATHAPASPDVPVSVGVTLSAGGASAGGAPPSEAHIPLVQAHVAPVHVPSVEPVDDPARHRLEVWHHPHPDRAAQAPHATLDAQLSPPSIAVASVGGVTTSGAGSLHVA